DETFSVNLTGVVNVVGSAPTFGGHQDFSTASYPLSVTSADFNRDGRPDLAVTNFLSDSVSVFLNTTAPGASAPSFAARADFATLFANAVSVLLNTTMPGSSVAGFAPKQYFGTGGSPSVTVGDLNGDGHPDLAVSNFASSTVSVLLNTTAPGAAVPGFAPRQD